MRKVSTRTVDELLQLSKLLGEFGQIERVTRLPDGRAESDSHHSFSLALIAYELAKQYAPELDAHTVLLYALVHDLSELVTGDVSTLMASREELDAKAHADAIATHEVETLLVNAPHILVALKRYEEKTDQESLFVYWIDKLATIPTHFYDNGENLRSLGIRDRTDIAAWYERTLAKLQKKGTAHHSAVQILELAYRKMHDELLDERK